MLLPQRALPLPCYIPQLCLCPAAVTNIVMEASIAASLFGHIWTFRYLKYWKHLSVEIFENLKHLNIWKFVHYVCDCLIEFNWIVTHFSTLGFSRLTRHTIEYLSLIASYVLICTIIVATKKFYLI